MNGERLGTILDMYLDIQKEQISETQNDEMITKFMVWHLGAVLNKYLDLYRESDINIHLDNMGAIL